MLHCNPLFEEAKQEVNTTTDAAKITANSAVVNLVTPISVQPTAEPVAPKLKEEEHTEIKPTEIKATEDKELATKSVEPPEVSICSFMHDNYNRL